MRPGFPACGSPTGQLLIRPGSEDEVLSSPKIAGLPADQKAQAESPFTTLRRGPGGGFLVVPYSHEYQGELAVAAALLREAAEATAQANLRAFLPKSAAALLSNDYVESDLAWMQLDSSIDPTFGPYEQYEDSWFNNEAAFEAFITVVDEQESEKLRRFSGQLQSLENALPMDDKFKNPKIGALAPIRVVNTLFNAGDANRGVQTAAYNLPNDERTVAAHGSKRIMLKNMQEAKFQKTLVPISKVAVTAAVQKNVNFDAFFTQILMHELMHGIGPQRITVGGRDTTPRAEIQEFFGAIESARPTWSAVGDAASGRPGAALRRDWQDDAVHLPGRACSARSASGSTRRTGRAPRCR
jgi:hypothetical protein